MVTVYRYQNWRGHGPYRRNGGELFPRHNSMYTHPTPCGDRTPDGRDLELAGHAMFGKWNFKCGFASLAQADEWFIKAERDVLKKHGFRLWRIELDPKDVIYGKRQVLIRKHARGKRTLYEES